MKINLTFIGHSTVLIDLNGFKIITDPVFSRWVYCVPRVKNARFDITKIQENTDLILISHAHKDHLNGNSLKNFSKNIPIGSHKNNKKYIKKFNFNEILEFTFWKSMLFDNNNVRITSVPATHGKTIPWGPIGTSGGFIIEGLRKTIYFAGDTAFDKDLFEEISRKFKINILLMPIGSYSPRWMLKGEHTNPDEAIATMNILNAEKMIPIHWGSFMFALDTPSKPIKVLKKKAYEMNLTNKIHILNNGESLAL